MMIASPAPEFGIEVPLKEVEKELSRQMQYTYGEGEAPVQRVRMSNLVVYCNKEAQLASMLSQLVEVTAVHPARVLLLVGDGNAGTGITAAVKVASHRLGATQQACTELIILRAPAGAVDDFPFAVRSLVIGDLPINLWWAADVPPPLATQLLLNLAEYAQQITYDSLGWPDPARGMAAAADWLDATERSEPGRWRVVSDLNWRRLKYWRRFITQAIEELEAKHATGTLTELQIEHGPHAVVQAWELTGWLAQMLGWNVQAGRVEQNVEMAWSARTRHGEVIIRIRRLEQGLPEVARVRMVGTLAGKPATLNLFLEDANHLTLQLEGASGAPRTMMLPELSPGEVVGRQLSDRERDPVFRESMAVAQTMAQSLVA
jgi:glucose-6-phosphate dehydrogenase assembly protein OpcA